MRTAWSGSSSRWPEKTTRPGCPPTSRLPYADEAILGHLPQARNVFLAGHGEGNGLAQPFKEGRGIEGTLLGQGPIERSHHRLLDLRAAEPLGGSDDLRQIEPRGILFAK